MWGSSQVTWLAAVHQLPFSRPFYDPSQSPSETKSVTTRSSHIDYDFLIVYASHSFSSEMLLRARYSSLARSADNFDTLTLTRIPWMGRGWGDRVGEIFSTCVWWCENLATALPCLSSPGISPSSHPQCSPLRSPYLIHELRGRVFEKGRRGEDYLLDYLGIRVVKLCATETW